jgi:hypothetical protein|tara:strand:- start:955 stop:1134 length:180 start_codon:yes stop_codon:yes gene_type:complete
MKKKLAVLALASTLTFNCGASKPSWERKDRTQVTQNDKAILGVLLSGLILFSLHTFVTR